ncbi:moesin/ezrin/radixin homolog 1-like [Diaphorina citri]|uniref:Moesin/ezrin/radixin homolog 1-like n=1 Tax=Diaphorina citri TaxID=121845 RepID=A0A1S4ENA1_DIACI|nr:moesin/ezrin/radixin homolog 1-like [Diaphorina citri]
MVDTTLKGSRQKDTHGPNPAVHGDQEYGGYDIHHGYNLHLFLYLSQQEEVENARNARKKQDEMNAALLMATSTPQHHHVEENEHDENDDNMLNGHVSRDLDTDDNIVDPVEERRTLAERNERLQDQLKVM